MTLKDLKIGNRFYSVKDYRRYKSVTVYEVVGNPVYNPKHGSPTRICKNLSSNKLVSKSCRIEVVLTNHPINAA